MRIDGTSISGLIQSADNLQAQQTLIAKELSSGVRLSSLSDDPLAAGQSAALSTDLASYDSFLSSATTVRNRMQTADSAIGSVVTQLTSAIATAVAAQNDTENSSDRISAGNSLAAITSSILSLVNSSYGGSYLFGGTASTTAPFSMDGNGNVTYHGDTSSSSMTVSTGDSVSTSIPGSSLFSAAFDALKTLVSNLQAGHPPTADAINNLRDALSTITSQRSVLDSNMNRLDAATTYTANLKTAAKAQQSTLLATDPVALASQLSATQTQRSALLSTLAVIGKQSLFDYL